MVNKGQIFNKAVNISHFIIFAKVRKGDTVLDATVGNGNDTLYLARAAGETGKVYGFDIQRQAIENTSALLSENYCSSNVELINDGHEKIDSYVKEQVRAVIFNLGYLPGSDRQICTRSSTTIAAVKKALGLIEKDGIVILVIYPGHSEGMKEKQDLISFCRRLPQDMYNVFYVDLLNQINDPAVLLGIEKSQ